MSKRNAKNRPFVWSNVMPNLQRGEGHASILLAFLCNLYAYFSMPFFWAMTQCPPPKYAPARGQGQGPRTQAQVKKIFRKNFQAFSKKKSLQKNFLAIAEKNVFQKSFQALYKLLTTQKIVLSSSRGQDNFWGLEASRPRPRTWPSTPRPSTSKCVLENQSWAPAPWKVAELPQPLLSKKATAMPFIATQIKK